MSCAARESLRDVDDLVELAHEPDLGIVARGSQLRNRAAEAAGLFVRMSTVCGSSDGVPTATRAL
jgi:hypothetical protein